MSFYFKSLSFAIPIFIILIIIEAIFAKIKGIKINRAADIISSQSSGMTNIIFDAIKFSIAIISYGWLVESIAIIHIKLTWISFIITFLVIDFAGYWDHRLSHRVNILWNRHFIHHSSEDFNLSCALRQSISNYIRFSAIFMIPAAILGIPASLFAIIAPIHLFLQFWYHTQLINKMGILEYILVTPSHHRVHHAINPEYIDKNYSQIFIFWDKLFGTFQNELKHIKPTYGTLKQANTWNPIFINFKHLKQLFIDSWRTKNILDKILIWFMPTGWRPTDVKKDFPLQKRTHNKYETSISTTLTIWSFFQLTIASIFLFHFLYIFPKNNNTMNYLYALLLLIHIFSFTSALDQKIYSIFAEILKINLGFFILSNNNYTWFNIIGIYLYIIIIYSLISFLLTIIFYLENKKQKKQFATLA
tara:strand:- start:572 stop:1825 length:1254 start_codon:yes stop_codon:yes gene_type:complete